MNDERPANRFLRRLTPASWERLAPELRLVSLTLGQAIYEPGKKVESVWFPIGAQLSQVNRSADGRGVETAMVGLDGAAGVVEALGSGMAIWESLVQVDGEAWRVPAAVLRRMVGEDPAFALECWRLIELQVMESQQSVACQALHSGEQRLARWLLEAYDRTGCRNPLPFTQEILALMLGVQRTTVTAFQAALTQKGLIAARRGRVELVDIPALEQHACPCRKTVQQRRLDLGLDHLRS